MTHQLESLKTMSLSVSCFQRTSRWGCTQVYGTQTIGQLEAVLLKRIGLKLHSWLLTETLRSTRNQTPTGTLKKWIQQAKLDSDGFRRITWSTIIVLTIRGFHREPLRNAQQAHRIFIYLSTFLSFFYVKLWMLCFLLVYYVWEFLFLFMVFDSFHCISLSNKGNDVSLLL